MSSIEIRVAGRYVLGEKIFQGPHSSVYMGRNAQSQNEVAIKCEPAASKNKFLANESTILSELQGSIGVPDIKWHGKEEDFYFMITDLFGNNLEDYFQICNRRFSLKTVLMIADQVISNIQYLHYKGYLHRDIKPENFVMGLGKKLHQVYTIDLGMAAGYMNPQTKAHVNKVENRKSFIGTLRYASLNVHKGCSNSRRDDLQSIGYMLIYFLKGCLPWSGIKSTNLDSSIKHIAKLKDINPEYLCKDLPVEFQKYMAYVKRLEFGDTPDYTYLKRLFREKLISEGFENDFIFDWILIPLRLNDEISSLMPLKTKTRVHDSTNLSICNYNWDSSQENEFSGDTGKSVVQDKPFQKSSQTRQQSAPKTVPPSKKPEVPKNKKDDCLLF